MGMMSKRKGRKGEQEVAQLCRDHGFPARRGVQFQGGPDSPDVVGLPGVHCEVKRTEKLSLYPALERAKTDKRDGDIPVVFHRANSRPWVAILPAEDFLGLLRAATPVRADSPIYGSPRLKEVIVESALKGEISQQEAEDMITEYGLREV